MVVPPISHPKCWSFLVGKPMGLLGKPTILGNPPYIHPFLQFTDSWLCTWAMNKNRVGWVGYEILPSHIRIMINQEGSRHQRTRLSMGSSKRVFLFCVFLKNEPTFNVSKAWTWWASQNEMATSSPTWEDFRKSTTRLPSWQRCNGEAFRWGRKKTHGGVKPTEGEQKRPRKDNWNAF